MIADARASGGAATFGLESRVTERDCDFNCAHGAVPAPASNLLGRRQPRFGVAGASPSEVDSLGALRRACAHLNTSSHR